MPAADLPRVEVSLPVDDGTATLAEIEAFCRSARVAGLRDDAEFGARIGFHLPVVVGGTGGVSGGGGGGSAGGPPRPTAYLFRASVASPEAAPTGNGRVWAVPGGPNTTTAHVADAIRDGLADPGIDRVVLDRSAAYLLVGAPRHDHRDAHCREATPNRPAYPDARCPICRPAA